MKPLTVTASDPIVVTKHEYLAIPAQLTIPVEGATPITDIWTEGDLYEARNHDSRWLNTCKAQLDGISALTKLPAVTDSPDKTK